jgi:hypothetical protein
MRVRKTRLSFAALGTRPRLISEPTFEIRTEYYRSQSTYKLPALIEHSGVHMAVSSELPYSFGARDFGSELGVEQLGSGPTRISRPRPGRWPQVASAADACAQSVQQSTQARQEHAGGVAGSLAGRGQCRSAARHSAHLSSLRLAERLSGAERSCAAQCCCSVLRCDAMRCDACSLRAYRLCAFARSKQTAANRQQTADSKQQTAARSAPPASVLASAAPSRALAFSLASRPCACARPCRRSAAKAGAAVPPLVVVVVAPQPSREAEAARP